MSRKYVNTGSDWCPIYTSSSAGSLGKAIAKLARAVIRT